MPVPAESPIDRTDSPADRAELPVDRGRGELDFDVEPDSDVEVGEDEEAAVSATGADDELHLLRDAVWGTLGAPGIEDPPDPDPDWRPSWSALAGLGVAALCVPESAGGFGRRADAAVTTAAALGAVLHGAPYAATVAAAHLLARASLDETADDTTDQDAATALLTDVLTGNRLCGYGHLDPARGVVRAVDAAAQLDALVVRTPDGGALLLDDPTSWSPVVAHPFDVTRAVADVEVDLAAARPLVGARPPAGNRPAAASSAPGAAAAPGAADRGTGASAGPGASASPSASAVPGDPGGAVEVADLLHGLLLAADALGGIRRCLDRTVVYAGQRQAFGRAIGGFQAVQHRLVDHAVRARGMERLVDDAARRLTATTDPNDPNHTTGGSDTTGSSDTSDPTRPPAGSIAGDAPDPATRRAVALAEASVARGSVRLLHDLLQLSGAIAFTWEHGLHLYERRAHQDAQLRANPRSAVRALATIEGWTHGR